MNPLRILILTCQGGIAGSTMSISYLCKGLAERGHKIILGCKPSSMYKHLLKNTSVQVKYLPFSSKWDRISIRIIRDIVQKEKIQLINAQASKDRYNAIFARWIYKLPVKVVHTRRQIPLSIGGLQSWFYTIGTDQIIAVSQSVKNVLIKKGIPEKHITVIYNGTPTEKYSSINKDQVILLKKKYNIKPHDIVIGCISRFKKQDQIIQALKYIKQPLTVLFIGINEKEMAKKINPFCNPHKIHYCGIINYPEVLNYYKLFNQFIMPSTTEGLSQSLLEAMFLGIPVITTRSAGNIDLIKDYKNGLLFENGNIKELTNKISLIIKDKKLEKSLSVSGKRTSQNDFSMQRTLKKYEIFFENLIYK